MPQVIPSFSEAQLLHAQAKVTCIGEQDKPVASIVFHVDGHRPDMDAFAVVQPGGKPYGNDELPYLRSFAMTTSEFARVLRGLGPVLHDAGLTKGAATVSFTVVLDARRPVEGQEFLVGSAAVRRFYDSLLGSLPPLHEGRALIAKQALDVMGH